MFTNYLKIAWRNLAKNKVFSFINIFGLSVGRTCCMLISLYIYHEISYDKYHVNAGKAFRLGTVFTDQGVGEPGANSSAPLGGLMQQEYPEIEASARILNLFRDDKTLFQVNESTGRLKSFYETQEVNIGYLLIDSNCLFLAMFSGA